MEEDFLGKGLYGELSEQRLAEQARERKELLAALGGSSGEARSAVQYKLNDLNKEIRRTIDESDLGKLFASVNVPDQVIEAWTGREYPYFLYA